MIGHWGCLAEAGITDKLAFRRSGFELRSPFLDVILSQSLPDLECDLAGINAAAEIFLGGVPTALYTGILAADCVLAE